MDYLITNIQHTDFVASCPATAVSTLSIGQVSKQAQKAIIYINVIIHIFVFAKARKDHHTGEYIFFWKS